MSKNEKSLRVRALAYSPQKIGAMVAKIRDSVERRHAFEKENGGLGGSWLKAKEKIEANEPALAMTFLALNLDPKGVFERQLVEGKMTNAKSIKKIVEISQLLVGKPENIEQVIKSFITCAILAADELGDEAPFTNDVNRRFLKKADLKSIENADLRTAMEEAQHKSMTTGAATQSSQMRNVLDLMGLGEVCKVERARDAIRINAGHGFYDYFRNEVMAAA